jgi:hypothetical protein
MKLAHLLTDCCASIFAFTYAHSVVLCGDEQNDGRVDALLCYCLNTGELHMLPIALGAGAVVQRTLERRYSGISLIRCVHSTLHVVVCDPFYCAHYSLRCVVLRVC